MGIIAEYYKTRDDGVILNRTYSDNGVMIERYGVRYSEAVDPLDSGRVYTETDEPVETGSDEATVEDYQKSR